MKDGKSITQFTRKELLTGDELFLVNQMQSDGGYISRYMTLDALKEYIETTSPVVVEVTVTFDANGGTGGWT